MRCYSTKVQEGGLILGDMPGNGLHDMMDALHAHSMPSVKVCGVTHIKEVNLLDELDVEFAGVWCGIAKGRYTLDPHQLTHLTGAPTRILKFILVLSNIPCAFLINAFKSIMINLSAQI
jgi:hypothetical protein